MIRSFFLVCFLSLALATVSCGGSKNATADTTAKNDTAPATNIVIPKETPKSTLSGGAPAGTGNTGEKPKH